MIEWRMDKMCFCPVWFLSGFSGQSTLPTNDRVLIAETPFFTTWKLLGYVFIKMIFPASNIYLYLNDTEN